MPNLQAMADATAPQRDVIEDALAVMGRKAKMHLDIIREQLPVICSSTTYAECSIEELRAQLEQRGIIVESLSIRVDGKPQNRLGVLRSNLTEACSASVTSGSHVTSHVTARKWF